jgi:hypothetical protein
MGGFRTVQLVGGPLHGQQAAFVNGVEFLAVHVASNTRQPRQIFSNSGLFSQCNYKLCRLASGRYVGRFVEGYYDCRRKLAYPA